MRVPEIEDTKNLIVRVVYRMLKYKVEYETIDIEEYEAKYKEQQTCAELVEASNT